MIINAYIHTYTGMMIEEKKGGTWKKGGHEYCDFVILAVPHMKKLILLAFVHSRKISLIVAHRNTFNFQELFWTLILPVTICLRICVRFSSSILCIGNVPKLRSTVSARYNPWLSFAGWSQEWHNVKMMKNTKLAEVYWSILTSTTSSRNATEICSCGNGK